MAKELPRIICDKCMTDVAVTIVVDRGAELAKLSCHDRVELAWKNRLIPQDGRKVIVWSEIEAHFQSGSSLLDMEKERVSSLAENIEALLVIHEVRRAQGSPRTIIPKERLDKLIDTLFLFREDQ